MLNKEKISSQLL
jgi:hypothetical protein